MTKVTLFVALCLVIMTVPVGLAADWVPWNGHEYTLNGLLLTGPAAEAYAEGTLRFDSGGMYQGQPTYLIAITSPAEENFVFTMFGAAAHGAWIGGWQDRTDPSYHEPDGGWKWPVVSDEVWAWTNWGSGEPEQPGNRGLGPVGHERDHFLVERSGRERTSEPCGASAGADCCGVAWPRLADRSAAPSIARPGCSQPTGLRQFARSAGARGVIGQADFSGLRSQVHCTPWRPDPEGPPARRLTLHSVHARRHLRLRVGAAVHYVLMKHAPAHHA